jgi:triacylglycerol esterase/lipase EstA (alpha/beta hydrolase family)
VLVGHSFGGLILQYYIANMKNNQASGNLLIDSHFFDEGEAILLMDESRNNKVYRIRKCILDLTQLKP